MSPILSPFESYRDTMTVLKGLRNYGCDEGAEGHSGAGTFLTCAAASVLLVRNARSIDQIIADQISGETLFKSLQLGMNATGEKLGTAISWADAETPLPKVTRPEALFTRLFGGGAVLTPEELEHRRSMELSILDGVFDDLQAFASKATCSGSPSNSSNTRPQSEKWNSVLSKWATSHATQARCLLTMKTASPNISMRFVKSSHSRSSVTCLGSLRSPIPVKGPT